MGNHNFCPICDGLIYLDSTESDHRIAKAAGGQGVLENGLLVYPFGNRIKSGGVSKSMLTLNEAIIDVKKG